jgi:hypothetical protein
MPAGSDFVSSFWPCARLALLQVCGAEGGGRPLTKQYVDHLAILIDGAVGVPLDGATEEEDLVDVPTTTKPTTMPPGRGRELWTEGLGPGEHGPGRDINATLSQEFGDLPGGERVAQVPTDRGDDDLRRPTVAGEGAAGDLGEVSMTEMASEALTTAAVETIARSGGLVAGRAGGRRPNLPRASHDFADSQRSELLLVDLLLVDLLGRLTAGRVCRDKLLRSAWAKASDFGPYNSWRDRARGGTINRPLRAREPDPVAPIRPRGKEAVGTLAGSRGHPDSSALTVRPCPGRSQAAEMHRSLRH